MPTLYIIFGFILYCGVVAVLAFILRGRLHKLAVMGDHTHEALTLYAILNVAIVLLTFLAILLNHAFTAI